MDQLFEGQTEKRERRKRVEKIFADQEGEGQGNATKEPLVTKLELDRAKMDLEETRSELVYLLERVKRIKPALGKEYLRLEMSPTRFETFKESIERKN